MIDAIKKFAVKLSFVTLIMSIKIVLISASESFAQEGEAITTAPVTPAATSSLSGVVGLGMGYVPQYDGADSSRYKILPSASIRFRDVAFMEAHYRGPLIDSQRLVGGINLLRNPNFNISPIIKGRYGRDTSDNKRLRKKDGSAALDDPSATAELGLLIASRFGNVNAGIEATQDILEGHEGFIVEIYGDSQWRLSPKFLVGLGLETSWGSETYMKSFFGVTDKEVAKLPSGTKVKAYSPEAGMRDIGLKASASYFVSDKLVMTLGAGYRRLLSQASDSPIVEQGGSANQYSLGLIFGYVF